MNLGNMQKAIAVMKRAQEHNSFSMLRFQNPCGLGIIVTDEFELHHCGNTACFAGHLAVSYEWLSDTNNFICQNTGKPVRRNAKKGVDYTTDEGIGKWLNVSKYLMGLFIYNSGFLTQVHPLYQVKWTDVTAEHVLRELTLLFNMGEKNYIDSKEYIIDAMGNTVRTWINAKRKEETEFLKRNKGI